METYIRPYVKLTASKNLLYDSGNSNWGSATAQRSGKGCEVGGRLSREGTDVYLQLIHVDVWQKPTQYYKAIILPLKIKKNIKKCGVFHSSQFPSSSYSEQGDKGGNTVPGKRLKFLTPLLMIF